MRPTFRADPRVTLVAAADPREEAGARFVDEFGGRMHASVEALVRDRDVEAVYVATPHQHHVAHVGLAAAAGKHVLCEKPLALSIDDAQAMVDACARAGVRLIVGHSHAFDAPVALARRIVDEGGVGRVRMITAMTSPTSCTGCAGPRSSTRGRAAAPCSARRPTTSTSCDGSPGARALFVRAEVGRFDDARPSRARTRR
jgi:phthalate 4,5-cis-dihydrodiol dehydrogenase